MSICFTQREATKMSCFIFSLDAERISFRITRVFHRRVIRNCCFTHVSYDKSVREPRVFIKLHNGGYQYPLVYLIHFYIHFYRRMSFDVTHVKTVFKRYSLHIMPSFSLLLYDTWTLYNTWSDNIVIVLLR